MDREINDIIFEVNMILNGGCDEDQLYINGYHDGLLRALAFMGVDVEYDRNTNTYKRVLPSYEEQMFNMLLDEIRNSNT